MSGKHIIMWQVSKEHWQNNDNFENGIFSFVTDALDIERRLPKGINLANERMRYQLCCRRIQNAVLQDLPIVRSETLDGNFLILLNKLAENCHHSMSRGRLANCFFTPELIPVAVGTMEELLVSSSYNVSTEEAKALQQRLSFFRNAVVDGNGVVETIDFLSDREENQLLALSKAELTPPFIPSFSFPPEDECRINDHSAAYHKLLAAAQTALRTGGAVNFSNQPHPIVTEVLNKMVYTENVHAPAELRVIYMDGTEAMPFPVQCLPRKEIVSSSDFLRIRASLVSMRHLVMDGSVDLAWFRNRQVSSGGSFAEVDSFCSGQTLNLLREIPTDQAVVLEMQQTGLETAVVGFYRGLVQFFLERQSKTPLIRVQPMYFDGRSGDYEEGTVWA